MGQGAAEWRANYTPETAREISGKTYQCESNLAGIETARMEFDEPDGATMFLKMGGEDLILPIGLDGSYRQAPEGEGYRGYWENAHIFHLEAFDIGLLSRQLTFDGQSVQISLPEAGLTVACQMQ